MFTCSLYIYSFFIILKINKHLVDNYQVSLKKMIINYYFLTKILKKY